MALLRSAVRAYAAGLVDGEGSIGTHWDQNNQHLRVRLRLSNTDPKMLKWLQDHFGGTIRPARVVSPRQKPVWLWDCSGQRFDSFIKQIYPFLITKREAAETAIAIRALMRYPRPRNAPLSNMERKNRDGLVLRLHQLNKRGVA